MRTTTEAERHSARRTWLTTAAAAEQLGGCSPAHVRALVADGHLRAFDAGRPGSGRHDWRFRQEWIDEYMTKMTRTPRAANGAA